MFFKVSKNLVSYYKLFKKTYKDVIFVSHFTVFSFE